MENFKNILQKAADQLGKTVVFEGIISKEGVINHGCGQKADDVLGFNYVSMWHHQCFAFYSANPPRIGMTQPTLKACPLGLRNFNDYTVDYKEAIRLLNTTNAGSQFTQINLYWPLTPEATEPCWHFLTTLGNHVVIGAVSGNVHVYNYQMQPAEV